MNVTIGKAVLKVDDHGDVSEKLDLIDHLSDVVRIEPGVTLGDVFTFIALNKTQLERIYASELRGIKIKPFLNEINRPAKPSLFSYIGFHWVSEFYLNDFNNTSELLIHPEISGWYPEGRSVGLSITPLYEVKDLEVKINTALHPVYSVNGVPTVAFESNLPVTVYDFFRAVVRELMVRVDME